MAHPFAKLLGLHILEQGDGRCVGLVEVTPQLMNPNGILHGGVLFSLADTCMGAALWSQLEPHETCTTIEIKVNFLRAVSAGTLRCESRVVHRGRSSGVIESDLTNVPAAPPPGEPAGAPPTEAPAREPVLVGKALGTFAILPRKPAVSAPGV